VNAASGTSLVVSALGKVSEAAFGTRAAAETVLTASQSVDTSVGNLRAEIESFLQNLAIGQDVVVPDFEVVRRRIGNAISHGTVDGNAGSIAGGNHRKRAMGRAAAVYRCRLRAKATTIWSKPGEHGRRRALRLDITNDHLHEVGVRHRARCERQSSLPAMGAVLGRTRWQRHHRGRT